MFFSSAVKEAQFFWQRHLKLGDGVVDATVGNGKDTLFLYELLKDPKSYLIGLDIQLSAIEKVRPLVPRARLYCQSHETFPPLPFSPRLIVYNLGYLPGGDKSITTQVQTTLQSLEEAKKIVAPGGCLSIVCYPGHAEGKKEEEALVLWASSLPASWEVVHQRWVNRKLAPSFLKIVAPHP